MAKTPVHPESIPATPARKPVDPGIVGAILEALENPSLKRPEQILERRQKAWSEAVYDVNRAEELLELINESLTEAPEDLRSLAIELANSHHDECRAHLLTLEAPDHAALQLKMRTFLEREGDMVRGTVGDELQGVFADVERLLTPASV